MAKAVPASSSSGELVDKSYIDTAIAQLERRIQQQLNALVQQEMAKLKEDILQTVVRLIPEDLSVLPAGPPPVPRLSSGGSEYGSDEALKRRTISPAASKSDLKKEEKIKKKEEKEKKKAEKEREKEVKKERRKSLSVLKKAGVDKKQPFMAEV